MTSIYDTKYCPYEIMGIDKDVEISKSELKKLFNYLAKKFHPDKGGSEKMFDILRWAYKSIYREKRKFWNSTQTISLNRTTDRTIDIHELTKSEIEEMKNNFKLSEFNKNFGLYKVKNEFEIETEKTIKVIEAPTIKKESNFNSEFEEHQNKNLKESSIVLHKEPVDVNTCYEAEYSILGREKINDFTTKKSTDFSKAFTVYNTIYHNVKTKSNVNDKPDFSQKINDRLFSVENQRKTQNFHVTSEQQKHYDEQKQYKTKLENERKKYLKKQDYLVQSNYQKYRNKLIYKK